MELLPTLIVDDSNMIVKIVKKALLSNQLKDFEFREDSIYTASDGMEAFEMMGRGLPIKLIITTVKMPNLNGDEFIEILEDTQKLKDIEVLFITSGVDSPKLSNMIRDKILGIIYKPFNPKRFIGLVQELYDEKEETLIKMKKLRELQAEKKKFIYKVTTIYLEKYCNKNIESLKTSQITLLNLLIDDIFGDDDVCESEFVEIVHSILSSFLLDVKIIHTIVSKNILCIIKNSKDVVKVSENRLKFIETFESKIAYVNSVEKLDPKEILKVLTKPLLDVISIAFVKVKNYPKVDSKLFSPHFNYIVDELNEIDCLFVDDKLEKLLLEHKEITNFIKWMYRFLYNDSLEKSVKIISSLELLKPEILRHLNKAYQDAVLLSQYYCGEIEVYLWKRAKSSKEIVNYLKKSLPKTIPSTYRYLLYKNKISKDKNDEYLALEKQNVLVISANLNTLKKFKDMVEQPLDKWNFFCYAKLSILDIWMNSNIPNKIIIDYNFKGLGYKNGVEFLMLLEKKYPVFKNVIDLKNVYLIAANQQLHEIYKFQKRYKFSVINSNLKHKDIEDGLLYH